mgnify:CR=1 FL=1
MDATEKTILICGGRGFDDWPLFKKVIGEHVGRFRGKNSNILIIQGGAKGADFLARIYANCVGFSHKEFPADWKKYGKAAGSIRNQQMLDEGRPDLVIAFPGGNGTADMVRRAKKAGVMVVEV